MDKDEYQQYHDECFGQDREPFIFRSADKWALPLGALCASGALIALAQVLAHLFAK
jgi:hypothetical protein